MNWTALGIGITALMGGAVALPAGLCCAAEQSTEQQAHAEQLSATASVELQVEGVTCASCTLTIRQGLKKLPGVLAVNPGKTKARVVVQYEPQKVTPKRIAEAVTRLGFPAKVAEG